MDTLYVLDEPSIGLHPRDNERLIAILLQLRDQGNSVLVVEHDADMIRVADHVVDLGLGAGEQGGRIIYSGSFQGLLADGRSLTARYLRDELAIPVPAVRRRSGPQRLVVKGASEHNLKDIDVEIPLGVLTCVTGVSGSGKSTLVHDVIYAAVKRSKGDWDRRVGAHQRLDGAEYVTDAVLVDQQPIGRTPRSNPVTYLKAFDPIRELFAATKDARARGLTASHFSFNVPGGRCEACEGEGTVRVEMQFLADVFVPCDQCDGKRFRPQVLEVRFKGKNIDQVLDLTVREALAFFAGAVKVTRRLQVLDEIGLGLSAARPAGDDVVRRRGAADQDRLASRIAERRSGALRARRAHDRPALRRHREAARGVPQAAAGRPHAAGDRAQPRRAEDGGLDRGSRTGGRRSRRPRRGGRHAGTGGRRCGRRTPDSISVVCLRPAGSTRTLTGMRRDLAAAVAVVCSRRLLRDAHRTAAVSRNGRTSSETCAIPKPRTRLDAVERLGRANYVAAVDPLVPLIRDPDDRVQAAAIDAELTFFLSDRVSDRRISASAARRAARSSPSRAGRLLRTARRRAAIARSTSLIAAMRDENARVRFDAVHALGFIAEAPLPPDQLRALTEELDHYDPVIRAATARVLGRLRQREAGRSAARRRSTTRARPCGCLPSSRSASCARIARFRVCAI